MKVMSSVTDMGLEMCYKSKNAKEFDERNPCQVSHTNYTVKVCLDAFYM